MELNWGKKFGQQKKNRTEEKKRKIWTEEEKRFETENLFLKQNLNKKKRFETERSFELKKWSGNIILKLKKNQNWK